MKLTKFALFFILILTVAFLIHGSGEIRAEEEIIPKILLIPELNPEINSEVIHLSIVGQAPLQSVNISAINLTFEPKSLSLLEIEYSESFCDLPLYRENWESGIFFACGNFSANQTELFVIAKISFKKENSGWTTLSLSDSSFFQNNGIGTSIFPENETHIMLID